MAQEVLEEEEEWNYTVIEDLGEARRQAEQLGIDLSKTARCGSRYAAAGTPLTASGSMVRNSSSDFTATISSILRLLAL